MLDRRNWELRNQPHEMWAEGLQDERPSASDINAALKAEGYIAGDIDIDYDNILQAWGWITYISKIQTEA